MDQMESHEAQHETKQFTACLKSSKRRIALVLSFLCLGCLLQGSTYSHVTSFFNIYAMEEKGLSSTENGIIMASYCLVFVLVTPLAAKLVTRKLFKDTNIMFFGWTLDALFTMAMSTTNRLSRGTSFFFGSLTLRIVGATGCAVGFLMLYIVTALELNEINHIVIPVLETIYGLSVVIGPAISGVLYDYGGYSLPFWAIGGALLVLMLAALLIFPDSKPVPDEEGSGNSSGLARFWKLPIIVNVLCALNAFCIVSYNEFTLAVQLKAKFNMSVSESGSMFLCAGGMYAFSSLLFGVVSKSVSDPRYLIVLSSTAAIAGLTLQGPLIRIKQTKTIVIIAQMLLGFGLGPTYVCSYLHSLKYIGSETKETYAALTALFTPATSIGCTLGPLVAGIIQDNFDYAIGVMINMVQLICMMSVLIITIFLTNGRRRSQLLNLP